MMKKDNNTKKVITTAIEVCTGLRAGYRPVHGLVAPDGWTRWVPGWFDLDSQGRHAATNVAPPPAPEE